MANSYGDGLDDFDRDVLGHVPLHNRHGNDSSNQLQTLGYFPTPTPSYPSNPHDGYGTYYEAILLPSPCLEPEPLPRAMVPEDVPQFRSTTALFRHEPAHLLREPLGLWQTGTPPLHAPPSARNSQPAQSTTSSSHGPGSSSPTARLSTRKQRNAPSLPNTLPPSVHLSPQTQPTPASQDRCQSSTPVVHGVPLVSLRQTLPDKFRAVFPYELLNAVQSKCFDVVYRSNDNVVVAAPTGSGKTAILELAMCKLALDRGNENFKIVYQAPTKALCSERARDWEKKFSHMNLRCAELTGDTSQAEMRRVGDASVIVTTPEKWDSITRKWQDHRKLLQLVELFLIDEVHILKDERGATLEAVVSRMKTIGANVRFIALSATVPNSDDIARWLGRNHTNQQFPAHREAFGEEFRPVKLQKLVYGFESNSNDFIFEKFLDQKLPGLIARHARQKPILVFCFTRKSCESTAALLAEFASDRPDGDKLWPVPSQRVAVLSRELQDVVKLGVAFHHAGLDPQDRAAVEQNFLKGQLGVICCTSTLAVGVNLPCHTIILKGTVGFANDKLEEYSDLEVMQMLGRAGRPQFDDSATAIILTRAANKERYQKMVSGQEILESTLHLNLIEHLNSEICLGTIHDLPSAKTWLGGTFLSVRLRRNPNYYQLTGGNTNPTQVDDKLEEICERDIKQLQEAELITAHDTLRCTEYGRAMSKYMVEFQTMKLLLQIPRGVGMEALITVLSQASEFKEFRFKPAERALFREVNQSPLILYPIKEAVTQTRQKISLMVQLHLGCVQYPDSSDAVKAKRQLMVEKRVVFERLNRLVRAVIDCKGHDRDAVGTKTALELARALAAESWEGRATQLTQVPSIGPVGMRKLASKDIRTVLQLADKQYDELERLMSRQPPFGKNLEAHLENFPRLAVEVAIVGHRVQPRSEEPVIIEVRATLRYLNRKGPPNWSNRVPALTFLAETSDGTLVYFWRGSMKKLDKQVGFDLKFSVGLRHVKDHVACHLSCEEIVGTIVSKTLNHKFPASIFPPLPNTFSGPGHSQQSQVDSQRYMEDDGLDDSELILVAEQAFSQSSMKQAPRVTVDVGFDEYPSVEELIELASAEPQAADKFDIHLAGHDDGDEVHSVQTVTREPVRLPNGKWQCNHVCSGGAPTRSGKPCTHRCCKEGLDKPRKRPAQRPKRKREEATDELVNARASASTLSRPQHQMGPSAGALIERQKTQAVMSLTQSTLTFSPRSAKASKQDWGNMDFDAMGLECIDLSFTDDEGDDIFQSASHLEVVASNKPVLGGVTNKDKQRDGNTQSQTGFSKSTSAYGNGKGAAALAIQQVDYQDDDFDDDCLSFLEGALPTQTLALPASTTSAFKSGASDQVLYQGISKKFGDKATKIERVLQPCRSSLPSSIGDVPGMTSDKSSSCSVMTETVPPTPTTKEETPIGDISGEKDGKPRKGGSEPAWVAEFDPEFVDMFRGYVTFV